MTTIPLCSKTDCLHEAETDLYKTADCDAYLFSALSNWIQYYEGRIYLLCGESTSNNIILLSMDTTGSDRKEIYTFKSAPTSIAIHRGYVYYNTSVYNADGKKTYGIAALSLKNPSKDPITVYAGAFSDGSVDEIRPYRNWVYFREFGTDQDGKYSNWEYAYRPANQQLTCLTDPVEQDGVDYSVSFEGFRDGKLLLNWQYKEGDNYYHRWWWADLDGTLLEECTAIPADFNGELYLDDDYFYLYDMFLDEGAQYYIHMLDNNGNTLLDLPVDDFDGYTLYYILVGNDTLFLQNIKGTSRIWAYNKAALAAGTINPTTVIDREMNELNNGAITVS
jgi:hypothetical protein